MEDKTRQDVGIFKVIQKLDKLQNDTENQFLNLNYNIQMLQIQISRMKTFPYNNHILTHGSDSLFKNDGHEMQKDVLKENLEHMVKDIDLENSELMDDLQVDECLTSDEAAEIIRKPARRDQVRKLILHIGRKSGDKFTKFMENLQKSSNYPHIATKLMDSYNNKTHHQTDLNCVSKCLVCILKRDVPVQDVIDKLYSNGLVPQETFEMIVDGHQNNNETMWNMILIHLKRFRDGRKARQVLQEALARKYEHISATINKVFFPEILCQCKNIKANVLHGQSSIKSSSNGSLGDISTTSDLKISHHNVPDSVLSQNAHSVSSDKSEQSADIDFKNIPSTVAWLTSIPDDANVIEPLNSSDLLSDIIQENQSVSSLDMDSVSKIGCTDKDTSIQFDPDKTLSIVEDTIELDRSVDTTNIGQTRNQAIHSTSVSSIKNIEVRTKNINENPIERSTVLSTSFQYQTDDDQVPASYASIVSRKSDVSKHKGIKNKQNSESYTQPSSSDVRVQKVTTSSKDTKPPESLSEIGTMYLSRQEKSTCELQKQGNTKCRKNKKRKGQNLSDPCQKKDNNDLKSPISSKSCNDHSTILQNVFFAEQEKIHGISAPKETESKQKNTSNKDGHLECKMCTDTKQEKQMKSAQDLPKSSHKRNKKRNKNK